MTALDDALLDDAAQLADIDRSGLLRAAAGAGAQVRAAAETAAEVGVDGLAGTRPRALVLLVRPGGGSDTARLITALLGPRCPVPVVTADEVPAWAGPLDVLLADTDDAGDRELAASIQLAGRRGATVVLSAPSEGPVAAAAAGSALLLPVRVPMPAGFEFPRAVAAALATVRALGLRGHTESDELTALADALDAEAERDRPSAESFVNPAKSLALRVAERTPLLWGGDPIATAVAARSATTFAAHAGVVADVADARAVSAKPALRAAALREATGADIFADPDLDEPDASLRVRPFLFCAAEDELAGRVRADAEATFSGIDVLDCAEQLPETAAEHRPVCAAMVLALRLEFAALYLGLATGVLGGEHTLAPSRI